MLLPSAARTGRSLDAENPASAGLLGGNFRPATGAVPPNILYAIS